MIFLHVKILQRKERKEDQTHIQKERKKKKKASIA